MPLIPGKHRRSRLAILTTVVTAARVNLTNDNTAAFDVSANNSSPEFAAITVQQTNSGGKIVQKGHAEKSSRFYPSRLTCSLLFPIRSLPFSADSLSIHYPVFPFASLFRAIFLPSPNPARAFGSSCKRSPAGSRVESRTQRHFRDILSL